MTDRHRRRNLFSCLWLATAVALILLLAINSAGHHPVSNVWLVLVPVFLFAVVVIQERCFVDQADAIACDPSPVLSLFQRPPPSLI